jgi:hypothetical protein
MPRGRLRHPAPIVTGTDVSADFALGETHMELPERMPIYMK